MDKAFAIFIGDCKFHNQEIKLYRDKHGKFYIDVDDKTVQKKLNASEMARWFLNVMNNR